MLLFFISTALLIITVSLTIFSIFKTKSAVLLYFLPTVLLYLGFLTTFLSFWHALTGSNLIIIQACVFGILFVVLCATHYLKQPNFGCIKKSIFLLFNTTSWHAKKLDLGILFTISLLAVLISASYQNRFLTPLFDADDLTYRAVAPLYWSQNQSIFRFSANDDRINVFALGSNLLTLWPVLFGLEQQIVNTVYWFAFPLLIINIIVLTNKLTKHTLISIFSGLLFAATPLINYYYTFTLVQESLFGLCLLSFFYTIIMIMKERVNSLLHYGMLGVSLALLVYIKATGIYYLFVMIPIILKISVEKKINKEKLITFITNLSASMLGGISALLLSGMFVILLQNQAIYDTPFGDYSFIDLHQAGLEGIAANTVRLSLLFIDIPLFSKELSAEISSSVNLVYQQVFSYLGFADDFYRIPSFAKYFMFEMTEPTKNFSLLGFVSLIIFIVLSITYPFTSRGLLRFIFILFFATSLIPVILIAWSNYGLPIQRHLLGSMSINAIMVGYSLYRIREKISQTLFHLIVIYALFVFGQYTQLNWNGMQRLIAQDTSYEDRFNTLLQPGLPLITSQATPVKIIVIKTTFNGPYVAQLFENNRGNRNQIYNISPADHNFSFKLLTQTIQDKQADYLVIEEQVSAQVVQELDQTYSRIWTPRNNSSYLEKYIIYQTLDKKRL